MPMPEARLPDAEARHTATTDLARNVVVVAGAGTGKTSLLVERVLVASAGENSTSSISPRSFGKRPADAFAHRRGARGATGGAAGGATSWTIQARRALGSLRSRGTDGTEVAARCGRARSLDHATVTRSTAHERAPARAAQASVIRASRSTRAGRSPRSASCGSSWGWSSDGRGAGGAVGRLLHGCAWTTCAGSGSRSRTGRSADLLRPPFPDPVQALLAPVARALISAADELLGREPGDGRPSSTAGLRDGLLAFVDRGRAACRLDAPAGVLAHPGHEEPASGAKQAAEADQGGLERPARRATHLSRGLLEIGGPLVAGSSGRRAVRAASASNAGAGS
jgi:hypothetical protein